MAIVHSSLNNVVRPKTVPFCQPQQLQCLHHGFTKAYLYSPLCSIPLSTTAQVTICYTRVVASVQDLGDTSASRGTFYTILYLEHYPMCLKYRTIQNFVGRKL